jgi:hypothetical protein
MPFGGTLSEGHGAGHRKRGGGVLVGPDAAVYVAGESLGRLFSSLWERFLKNEPPVAINKLRDVVHPDDVDGVAPATVPVYICHLRKIVEAVNLDLIVSGGHVALVALTDENRKRRAEMHGHLRERARRA